MLSCDICRFCKQRLEFLVYMAVLLWLHLPLERIQSLGELFYVTLARSTLQRLPAESTRRVGALAVGAYLMFIQGVAAYLLAPAFVACPADFASLVPVVVGGRLTWRGTLRVLGKGVGDDGTLRRRGMLRLRWYRGWSSMLLPSLIMLSWAIVGLR
jgi:hypothetical protein